MSLAVSGIHIKKGTTTSLSHTVNEVGNILKREGSQREYELFFLHLLPFLSCRQRRKKNETYKVSCSMSSSALFSEYTICSLYYFIIFSQGTVRTEEQIRFWEIVLADKFSQLTCISYYLPVRPLWCNLVWLAVSQPQLTLPLNAYHNI